MTSSLRRTFWPLFTLNSSIRDPFLRGVVAPNEVGKRGIPANRFLALDDEQSSYEFDGGNDDAEDERATEAETFVQCSCYRGADQEAM